MSARRASISGSPVWNSSGRSRDVSWQAVKKTLPGARQDVERKAKAREAKRQYLVPAHNLDRVVCTQWKRKTIGETLAAEKGKAPVKT